MGFFDKVFKGVKKVFKGVGKGIKKVVGFIGKAVNKLGIVGQIGMMFFAPYLGGFLGSMMKGATGFLSGGGLGAIGQGVGKVLEFAGKFANTVGNVFKTVTDGVMGFVKHIGGKVVNKLSGGKLVTSMSDKTLSEAFNTWMEETSQSASSILDPFKGTEEGAIKDAVKETTEEVEESLLSSPDKATQISAPESTVETSAAKASGEAHKKFVEVNKLPQEFSMTDINNDIAKEVNTLYNDTNTFGSVQDTFKQDEDFLGINFEETIHKTLTEQYSPKAILTKALAPEQEEYVQSQVQPRYMQAQQAYMRDHGAFGATPHNRIDFHGLYAQTINNSTIPYQSPKVA